ncbi:hypothetical protein AHiyo1_50590 [Arthrobacter sp. Hiyo1]|nr:hypothetical protein AHiyo1_50590 [Arthrobacter sp. Hiyo1]
MAIDERLTGVAINPVMDQCFDGDFDGDAVAVVKLHSEAAKQEAMEKLSVPANLLDTGVVKNGEHPLAMQVSLDTQVAVSKDPFLANGVAALQTEANEAQRAPGVDSPEKREARATSRAALATSTATPSATSSERRCGSMTCRRT